MNLKGILAISGYSGLYKHVAQTKNGIIVESLEDQKRMPAFSSSKISSLEDIAIFTTGEDILLSEVFKKIFQKEDGKQAISAKSSNQELKAYFESVLPEFDKDRVYVSDIKRVIAWYNSLQSLGLIDLEETVVSEEENKEELVQEAVEVENLENKE